MLLPHLRTLGTFALVAFVASLTAPAQSSTHGDISAKLVPIGNPQVDFGYRAAVNSEQTASTTSQDLAPFLGKLHLAYGDSGGGGGSKLSLRYDPAKGTWWFDNDESQRWDEEQLDHFRFFGSELYLHSYDGGTPGNQLYIRDASGWRVVNTGLGDHMRDTARFGDRIWTVDASTTSPFPRLFSAPASSPNGTFTRFSQTAPAGFTNANDFLALGLFEFNGVAYASALYSGAPSPASLTSPWLLSLDYNTPGATWQVAHANPAAGFFPEGYLSSLTSVYVSALTHPVVINGKFGTDSPDAPPRPMLLFPNSRLRTDTATTTSGLWIADGITTGERRLIPLTGLPTNTSLSSARVIQREGRTFAGFTRHAAYGDTDRRNQIWVYELTNPGAADSAAGWTLLFTGLKEGLATTAFDYLDGRFYFVIGLAQNADFSATINQGYTGTQSLAVFDPANTPPTVTRSAPAPSNAATFAVTVAAGAAVTVTVTVTDPDPTDTIAAVRLYSEDQLVGNLVNTSGSTWSLAWTPPSSGRHRLQVVAEDSRGAKSNWGRLLNLTATNTAPTATITAPTGSQVVTAAQPLFALNAADVDSLPANSGSRIARVVWLLNGAYLGESSTAPFSFTWTNPVAGAHSLAAQVFDTDGASVTSAAVAFTYGVLQLTTTSLEPATVSIAYSTTLAAAGGTGPYTFALAPGSAALPAGLTLAPGGALTGNPAGPATTANLTVRVTDNLGATADRALTLAVGTAPALAHEPFAYDRDLALANRSGGRQWHTAWTTTTAPQNFFTAPDSLAYVDAAGERLAASGGRLQLRDSAQITGIQRLIAVAPDSAAALRGLTETLNSANIIGADSTTVYVSFLVRVTDPRSGNYQVELRNNAATSFSGLRFQQDYRTGRLVSGTFSSSTALGPAQADVETKFIVLRIDFGSANSDTARVYLNPTLSAEPGSATATLSGSSFAFDRIFVSDGGTTGWSDGRELALDEIRIGTTWAEVAPISQSGLSDAPSILSSPADLDYIAGAKAVFTVVADGKRPYTYQWRKDGVPLTGATASSLEVWSVTPADAGRYDVIVTNAHGSTTSSTARLSVVTPGGPPRPSVLGLSAAPTTTVPLVWRAAVGASSYTVTRATSPAGPYTTIASGLSATNYTDSSAPLDTPIYYRVLAVSAEDSSLPSPLLTTHTTGWGPTAILTPSPGTTFAPLQTISFNGSGTNLSWSVTGAVTGSGSGGSLLLTVPAEAQHASTFIVHLTGDNGTAQQTHSIVDAVPAINTTSLSPTSATIGAAYNAMINATGGDGSLTYSLVSGLLPSGISLSGNSLTGSASPGTAGIYNFTVRVTDADGDTADRAYTLSVSASNNVSGTPVTLLEWDFDDSTTKAAGAPSSANNATVLASNLTGGPGATISANASVNLDAVGLSGIGSATFDASDFLTWTLTPSGSNRISLTRVAFGFWHNDTGSVATMRCELRVSTDEFSSYTVLPLSPSPLNLARTNLAYATGTLFEADLTPLPSLQLFSTGAVQFRLYVWGMSTEFKNAGIGKLGASGAGRDLWIEGIIEPNATPFQQWAAAAGLSGDDALPSADPDADGLTNLFEYALDGTPTSPTSAPAATVALADNTLLTLTFLRARAELTYEVLGSPDLVTWSVLATDPGTVGQSVTVSDSTALTGSSRRFLRLRVTAP